MRIKFFISFNSSKIIKILILCEIIQRTTTEQCFKTVIVIRKFYDLMKKKPNL